jgi:hypothetical protein
LGGCGRSDFLQAGDQVGEPHRLEDPTGITGDLVVSADEMKGQIFIAV